MKNFSFENLIVYQKAKSLIKDVYSLTEYFPQYERFGLCSQLQRSIVSVVSNIAEGTGRKSLKEKIHFLEISYGSLMEAYCQLGVAADLNYIDKCKIDEIKPKFIEISVLINSLSKSYENQIDKKML